MKDRPHRPVDISEEFRQSGMTLITDPESDRYLNASTKLETPFKEGEEAKA